MNEGHYLSIVKGPQGYFKTNDADVRRSTEREFLTWPYYWLPMHNNTAVAKVTSRPTNANSTRKPKLVECKPSKVILQSKDLKPTEGQFEPYILTFVKED